MVSRLLRDCGVYLGAEKDLAPPSSDNEDGFWENLRLVQVNEAVLGEFGASWDLPLPMPHDFPEREEFTNLRLRADIATSELRKHPVWGWKDPRNSLTFPFWKTLFPEMKVVICVRHPFEVALSLRRRNNLSCEMALTLWAIYNQRILEATSPKERIVTHYESYFRQPQSELRRIAEFLNLSPSDDELLVATKPVRASLRHNSFSTSQLVEFGASDELISLYEELCEMSGWPIVEADSRPSGRGHAHAGSGPRKVVDQDLQRPDAPARFPAEQLRSVGRFDRASFELELTRRDLSASQRELASRTVRVRELEAALESKRARLIEVDSALQASLASPKVDPFVKRERERQILSMESRIRAGNERLDQVEKVLGDTVAGFSAEQKALRKGLSALTVDRARLAGERDVYFLQISRDRSRIEQLQCELTAALEEKNAAAGTNAALRHALLAIHSSRLWRSGSFYWRVRERLGLRNRK